MIDARRRILLDMKLAWGDRRTAAVPPRDHYNIAPRTWANGNNSDLLKQ
jgi:hypothetical protein